MPRPGEKKEVDDQTKRIEELERTVQALVQAIKEAETEWDHELMPAGTYYGVKFNE